MSAAVRAAAGFSIALRQLLAQLLVGRAESGQLLFGLTEFGHQLFEHVFAAAGQDFEHFARSLRTWLFGAGRLAKLIVLKSFAGGTHPADRPLLPGQMDRVGDASAGQRIVRVEFRGGLFHRREELVELAAELGLAAGQFFQIGLLLRLEIFPLLAEQLGAKLFGRLLQLGFVVFELGHVAGEAAIAIPLAQPAEHLLQRADHSQLMRVDVGQGRGRRSGFARSRSRAGRPASARSACAALTAEVNPRSAGARCSRSTRSMADRIACICSTVSALSI